MPILPFCHHTEIGAARHGIRLLRRAEGGGPGMKRLPGTVQLRPSSRRLYQARGYVYAERPDDLTAALKKALKARGRI